MYVPYDRDGRYAAFIAEIKALDLLAVMQDKKASPMQNLETAQYDARDLVVAGLDQLAKVVAARKIISGIAPCDAEVAAWRDVEESLRLHVERQLTRLNTVESEQVNEQ